MVTTYFQSTSLVSRAMGLSACHTCCRNCNSETADHSLHSYTGNTYNYSRFCAASQQQDTITTDKHKTLFQIYSKRQIIWRQKAKLKPYPATRVQCSSNIEGKGTYTVCLGKTFSFDSMVKDWSTYTESMELYIVNYDINHEKKPLAFFYFSIVGTKPMNCCISSTASQNHSTKQS